jgi:hypothetical protein
LQKEIENEHGYAKQEPVNNQEPAQTEYLIHQPEPAPCFFKDMRYVEEEKKKVENDNFFIHMK